MESEETFKQVGNNKIDIKKHLISAFNFFDVDGSGYITKNNLATFLCPVDVENCPIDFIIQEVDQTGDGRIDLMEFLSVLLDQCQEDDRIVTFIEE